ncbi:MAG: aminotransferase [Actinobacteria bacterium]|nr:MAG: aminotransferase [Actinomycetota bacterium]
MARVLLISHEPEAAPGRIGELLVLRGIRTQQHIVLEDPTAPNLDFPEPGEYDAVIAFGSFANAYEVSARAWVGPEIKYIEQLVAQDIPYLGVCFGGQLLAEALGGHVEPAPPGEAEIGLIFLDPGEQGLPIPAGPWFTWHEDRMVIPDSVELLASTPSAVQLFRSGRAVGTQFHPEADLRLVSGWAAIGPDHIPSHTSAAEVLADVGEVDELLRRNCDNLVEWFIQDIAGLEFAELKNE